MHLYLATTNPGKLRDFANALTPGFTLLPLPNLASLPVPVEDAETFEGNACLKAIAYSLAAPGLMVLADDSGLEVDALAGAPGVRSARFAEDVGFVSPGSGSRSMDERNNLCLLDALARTCTPRSPEPRTGRYHCVLALAQNGKVLTVADGTVEGHILVSPQGANGFGYDPFFLVSEAQQTMAQLDPETRFHYSHRGRALTKLLGQI